MKKLTVNIKKDIEDQNKIELQIKVGRDMLVFNCSDHKKIELGDVLEGTMWKLLSDLETFFRIESVDFFSNQLILSIAIRGYGFERFRRSFAEFNCEDTFSNLEKTKELFQSLKDFAEKIENFLEELKVEKADEIELDF